MREGEMREREKEREREREGVYGEEGVVENQLRVCRFHRERRKLRCETKKRNERRRKRTNESTTNRITTTTIKTQERRIP